MIFGISIVIFILTLFLTLFHCAIPDTDDKSDRKFISIVCHVIVVLITALSFALYNYSIPAIEVYRGNTTLKITYQDSVPIDSTVIYK